MKDAKVLYFLTPDGKKAPNASISSRESRAFCISARVPTKLWVNTPTRSPLTVHQDGKKKVALPHRDGATPKELSVSGKAPMWALMYSRHGGQKVYECKSQVVTQ